MSVNVHTLKLLNKNKEFVKYKTRKSSMKILRVEYSKSLFTIEKVK